jgi:hypothetical protein
MRGCEESVTVLRDLGEMARVQLLKKAATDDGEGDLERKGNRGE